MSLFAGFAGTSIVGTALCVDLDVQPLLDLSFSLIHVVGMNENPVTTIIKSLKILLLKILRNDHDPTPKLTLQNAQLKSRGVQVSIHTHIARGWGKSSRRCCLWTVG
jgi:hypothetical protein